MPDNLLEGAERHAVALALDEREIARVVAAIRDAVPHAATAMVLFSEGGPARAPLPVAATMSGFEQRDTASFFAYFHALNPFDRSFAQGLHARATTAAEMVEPSRYVETEFYRDWARHTETLETGIGVPFFRNGRLAATLSLNFGPGVSDEDCQALKPALNRLATVIDASLSNQAALYSMSNRRIGLIDTLAAPAFVIAINGKLLSANGAGEQMLVDGGLIRAKDGYLQLMVPEAQAALIHQLEALRGEGALAPSPVILPRTSGSAGVLRLLPFMGSGDGRGVGGLLATLQIMIVLIDPDVAPKPPVELLRKVYGLTASEAAVAMAIAEGRTLEEHAQANELSVLTVRNQLRSASERMGARRQSDVVSRVLRLGLATGGV